MWDWLIKDILTALLIGVISSAIFLALLGRFRPKIEISPWLHRVPGSKASKYPDKKIYRYVVKICNRTRWFPVVDVRAILRLAVPDETIKSFTRHVGLKRVGVTEHTVFSLDPYDRGDEECGYLYRFVFSFYEPLEDLMQAQPGSFVRFNIVGRHSLSGFGSLAEQRFYGNKITECEFAAGNGLELAEPSDPHRITNA